MKAIILDYGATLDSSGKHWAEVMWDSYTQAALPVTKEQFREAYIYAERYLSMMNIIMPEQNFFELMQVRIGIQINYMLQNGMLTQNILETTLRMTSNGEVPILEKDEIIQHFVDFMSGICYDYARRCTLEAIPVVEYLSDKYDLALVSNFYGNLKAVLQDFGLLRCFKVVVDSTEAGVRKPDPQIFQVAIEQLGYPAKEITIVGDSYEKDILPATTLGCQAIWYRGDSWDPELDKTRDFQPTINNLLQIYDLL